MTTRDSKNTHGNHAILVQLQNLMILHDEDETSATHMTNAMRTFNRLDLPQQQARKDIDSPTGRKQKRLTKHNLKAHTKFFEKEITTCSTTSTSTSSSTSTTSTTSIPQEISNGIETILVPNTILPGLSRAPAKEEGKRRDVCNNLPLESLDGTYYYYYYYYYSAIIGRVHSARDDCSTLIVQHTSENTNFAVGTKQQHPTSTKENATDYTSITFPLTARVSRTNNNTNNNGNDSNNNNNNNNDSEQQRRSKTNSRRRRTYRYLFKTFMKRPIILSSRRKQQQWMTLLREPATKTTTTNRKNDDSMEMLFFETLPANESETFYFEALPRNDA